MASRDINLLVPELRSVVPLIQFDYQQRYSDRILKVACTLRPIKEQNDLWKIGREIPPLGKRYIVTNCDGYYKVSNHNPTLSSQLSRAVDFAVIIHGKYMGEAVYYYDLLEFARKYNMISGLDFRNSGLPLEELLKDGHFHDAPHIETKK